MKVVDMFEHDNEADNALEELFREKLQECHIDYRKEDWLRLKKRLDLLFVGPERNN
ncbi:hypothetical protein [Rhodohalobacter sp. 614A]|jgi:hypothetical protein|uniref:hypothetical protein n=1 Tax=Rhodohalobacter sp. 614A TaxID=2908649 RepID=UPI001F24A7C7|nr:hypothetical protein [Rhodohalobacter sp. 614A]